MHKKNIRRSQDPVKEAVFALNHNLVGVAVTFGSSRLRSLYSMFRANLHEIGPLHMVIDVDAPADLIDSDATEALIKNMMKKDFARVEAMEALAQENRKHCCQCMQKFRENMSRPPLQEEWCPICEAYSLTEDVYIAIERLIAKRAFEDYSNESTKYCFSIDAELQTTTTIKDAVIPQSVVLRWVEDIRRERAAQSRSRH